MQFPSRQLGAHILQDGLQIQHIQPRHNEDPHVQPECHWATYGVRHCHSLSSSRPSPMREKVLGGKTRLLSRHMDFIVHHCHPQHPFIVQWCKKCRIFCCLSRVYICILLSGPDSMGGREWSTRRVCFCFRCVSIKMPSNVSVIKPVFIKAI